jgi:hypothetical protein
MVDATRNPGYHFGYYEFSRTLMQAFGQFALLQFHPPGSQFPWPVAVLLLDPSTDKLHVRAPEDYAKVADEEDAEVVRLIVEEFQVNATSQSGKLLLTQLEAMEYSLRTTDRIPLPVRDFPESLSRLFAAFFP